MKDLSRVDIKVIAEKIIKAYRELPEVKNKKIYRIEPELLLTKLLGLKIEYQHLSLDGSILGMTAFQEIGVEVFDEVDTDTYFFLDGKTVLVEKNLKQDTVQKGRFNFTMMHEGSHQIFKMLYPNNYGVKNAEQVHFYKINSERNKPISDWEEWQANTLASAILLPKDMILQGMFLFELGEKVKCLNKIYHPAVYEKFLALADFLGCSRTALAIRMKRLGLLEQEYLDNPHDYLAICKEVSK